MQWFIRTSSDEDMAPQPYRSCAGTTHGSYLALICAGSQGLSLRRKQGRGKKVRSYACGCSFHMGGDGRHRGLLGRSTGVARGNRVDKEDEWKDETETDDTPVPSLSSRMAEHIHARYGPRGLHQGAG